MTNACDKCLSNQPFLAELCCLEDRKPRLGALHRLLKKGETLYAEGERPHSVYFIRKGLIRLYRNVRAGQQAVLRLVRAGELFGCDDLLGGETRGFSAEATRPTELCVFSAAAFFEAVDLGASFARGLLRRMALEQRDTSLNLLRHSSLDATGKIAMGLMELGPRAETAAPGTSADFFSTLVSRAVLGNISGLAPETVSRVLGKLDHAGLIERRGRTILIRDREALRDLARV